MEVTGYPAFDRPPLDTHTCRFGSNNDINTSVQSKVDQHVTIIGDAAHPMSPFKGQGANQALIDALHLARGLNKVKHIFETEEDVLFEMLGNFEGEMLQRSEVKVKREIERRMLHAIIYII